VIAQADSIKSNLGWVATILGLIAYGKLRFVDARTIKKLQKIYGKERFLQALNIILNLLDSMNVDQLVNKVLSIDSVDSKMRGAMKELRSILGLKSDNCPKSTSIKLKIPKKAQKELKAEIRNILKVIDKKIELHYIEREAGFKEKFANAIEKAKGKRDRYSKMDEKLQKRGKEKLIS